MCIFLVFMLVIFVTLSIFGLWLLVLCVLHYEHKLLPVMISYIVITTYSVYITYLAYMDLIKYLR